MVLRGHGSARRKCRRTLDQLDSPAHLIVVHAQPKRQLLLRIRNWRRAQCAESAQKVTASAYRRAFAVVVETLASRVEQHH